jgi:uncharacterized MAPEG superfamily protein
MILIVLLVLALFVLQTLLPNRFREPALAAQDSGVAGKLKEILGPRDDLRPYTPVGARAARALGNMQEALPVFLALALMNLFVGPGADAIMGAWIFLIARVVYVPLYLGGIPVLRTLVWVVSWVGLIMMLLPLLDRI